MRWEMDGTGLGSYLMAGFASGIYLSGSTSRELVNVE
jgi:hypothetical protein